MVFVSNVEDEVNCKDQAGAATGLPDLPAFTLGKNLHGAFLYGNDR